MALSKSAESNRCESQDACRFSGSEGVASMCRGMQGYRLIEGYGKICTEIRKYFCAYRVIDGQFYQR